MIIVGIGSNLGYPLENLREALRQLKRLFPKIILKSVSPVYASEAQLMPNAPLEWQKNYLNIAVSIEAQKNLSPEKILKYLKKIEKNMGRMSREKWAPRMIDLDILVWKNLRYQTQDLIIPHPELLNRPFALLPLLDIYPDFQPAYSQRPQWLEKKSRLPFKTHKISQRLNCPILMGIMNLTPDSFSDGMGDRFLDMPFVLKKIDALIQSGAEIIDIGAESTRPGAIKLDQKTEFYRLKPLLKNLKIHLDSHQHKTHKNFFRPLISLDTYHVKTVSQILNNAQSDLIQVNIINDVSGENCVKIAGMIKNTDIKYIAMHNLGVPASSQVVLPENLDPVHTVYQWGKKQIEKLLKLGLKPAQIIFDPGIGFGKTAFQSWEIIRRLSEFKALGVKILVGHSRKSFLNSLDLSEKKLKNSKLNHSERDFYTAIVSYHLALQNIDYLRIHQIKKTAKILKIRDQLQKYRNSE